MKNREMNSRERGRRVLNYQRADRISVDFGGTVVTGIHCLFVEKLKDYYTFDTAHTSQANKPLEIVAAMNVNRVNCKG